MSATAVVRCRLWCAYVGGFGAILVLLWLSASLNERNGHDVIVACTVYYQPLIVRGSWVHEESKHPNLNINVAL